MAGKPSNFAVAVLPQKKKAETKEGLRLKSIRTAQSKA